MAHDDNIEIDFIVGGNFQSAFDKINQSLQHIAVSSRAGAITLQKFEDKIDAIGKSADRSKEKLKVLFTIDLSRFIAGGMSLLEQGAKTFAEIITGAFKTIADNADITDIYVRRLGSLKEAASYQDYNRQVGAKYGHVSQQDINRVGLATLSGGFRGRDYAQVQEASIAVEALRRQNGTGGGAGTMEEVVNALSRVKNQGLRRPDFLRSVFGIDDIAGFRKRVEQETGLTLEELNKKIAKGEISGIGLVHIIEEAITKGKDFNKALSEDFTVNELIDKIKALPTDLLSTIDKTKEWVDLTKALNDLWKVLLPNSKAFKTTQTGVAGLFQDILKTATDITQELTKWLGKDANIDSIKQKFEDLKDYLDKNFWQPLTDPDLSVYDKIKLIAFKIGKIFVDILKPVIIALFTDVIIALIQQFKPNAISKQNASKVEELKELAKKNNDLAAIDALKSYDRAHFFSHAVPFAEYDEFIKLKGIEDKIKLNEEVFGKKTTSGEANYQPNGGPPIKVEVINPEKIAPTASTSGTSVQIPGDVYHTYHFAFGDVNLDAYGDPAEIVKALNSDSANIPDALKKSVQRALENVRHPKDQGR